MKFRRILLVIPLLLLCPAPARCLVQAEFHGPGALSVRASDASIGEILDVLSASFKIKRKLANSLKTVVSGSYSGDLHQVLERVLEGYDYIIKVSDDEVEIVVLGDSQSGTSSRSMPTVIANQRPAPPPGSPAFPTTSARK